MAFNMDGEIELRHLAFGKNAAEVHERQRAL
jgi:hypothetical protein